MICRLRAGLVCFDLFTKSNTTYHYTHYLKFCIELMLGCSSYYGLVVTLNGSKYLHCSLVGLDSYATGFWRRFLLKSGIVIDLFDILTTD